MKVVVFGANGRTGQHIVNMALQNGHRVTAFIRTQSDAFISHPNLSIVKGDVLCAEDVEHAIRKQEVVISSLGITSKQRKTICSEGIQQIVPAMEKYQVKRLIAISEASVTESLDKVSIINRSFIRLILDKTAIQDKEDMEAVIRNSSLDWTIVRPPFLTNGPLKKQYRTGDSGNLKLTSTISRADLADFMVDQIVDTNQTIKKAIAIHY
ncbi:NAD(P)-dependent oxidoreductase [Shimazuella kribbensis]|uniref:NAD(P)-dependent oxidoreductase n=1 Tax=Shimazuella kribbensis TaxID=139808 RepID=UPI000420EEC5|nr:SDR family oxidoreductase [Shimazuella kribbensis]